jgi:hypothetical protein
MATRIQPITAGLTAPLAAGSLLLPSTSDDGVDITNWRPMLPYRLSYDAATVYLIASAAATLGDTSNPIYLLGYRNAAWWIAGKIDGGDTIVFPTGGLRQARRIGSVGIFDRLAVACAALGGTTYQYQFEPIAENVR